MPGCHVYILSETNVCLQTDTLQECSFVMNIIMMSLFMIESSHLKLILFPVTVIESVNKTA